MKRRLLIGTAMGVAMLVSSLPAFAQSAADTQAQINAMQAQIQALQAQLQAIKAQTAAPAASSSGPSSSDGVLATAAKYLDSDDTLTWHGVTFYATVDVAVGSQSHGTALNSDYAPGTEELLGKNSNHAVTGLNPNGLSQSSYGIRGTEELLNGLSLVFRADGGFDPVTGTLSNGVKSVLDNNGVALRSQTSNGDSSRDGQVFNNMAYFGLSNPTFGSITFGRHQTVLADAVIASDPQGGAYAASVVGYSGAAGGAGNTEDFRLDDTIKYSVKYGPIRLAALYQFAGNTNPGKGDDAYQGGIGVDYMGFTLDFDYAHKNDAIAVSSTTTALDVTAASLTGATPVIGRPLTPTVAGTPITIGTLTATNQYLSATVSDNTAMMVSATYTPDFLPFKVKLFGAYERIDLQNPSSALAAGFSTVGGYEVGLVNAQTGATATYNEGKQLDYYWGGIKYWVIPEVTLTPAYYRIEQNNYSGRTQIACLRAALGSCSGTENVGSFVIDWNLTKRFDVYTAIMYSHVEEGLDIGYINNNTMSEMIGGRVKF
jgi:predicted porin